MEEVLISANRLKRLEACEVTLYCYHRGIRLCPVCKKGMLCDDNICPCCDYDGSTPVEEWKKMN